MTKSNRIAEKDDYTPTPQELALLEPHIARREEKPPPPRMTVTKKGGVQILGNDHPEPTIGQVLLMDALGAQISGFHGGLTAQLAHASSKGEVDEAKASSGASFTVPRSPRRSLRRSISLTRRHFVEQRIGPHGGLDRRILAVLAHQHGGGSIDVDIVGLRMQYCESG